MFSLLISLNYFIISLVIPFFILLSCCVLKCVSCRQHIVGLPAVCPLTGCLDCGRVCSVTSLGLALELAVFCVSCSFSSFSLVLSSFELIESFHYFSLVPFCLITITLGFVILVVNLFLFTYFCLFSDGAHLLCCPGWSQKSWLKQYSASRVAGTIGVHCHAWVWQCF
jgi:hypothetical protein